MMKRGERFRPGINKRNPHVASATNHGTAPPLFPPYVTFQSRARSAIFETGPLYRYRHCSVRDAGPRVTFVILHMSRAASKVALFTFAASFLRLYVYLHNNEHLISKTTQHRQGIQWSPRYVLVQWIPQCALVPSVI